MKRTFEPGDIVRHISDVWGSKGEVIGFTDYGLVIVKWDMYIEPVWHAPQHLILILSGEDSEEEECQHPETD